MEWVISGLKTRTPLTSIEFNGELGKATSNSIFSFELIKIESPEEGAERYKLNFLSDINEIKFLPDFIVDHFCNPEIVSGQTERTVLIF